MVAETDKGGAKNGKIGAENAKMKSAENAKIKSAEKSTKTGGNRWQAFKLNKLYK